MTQRSMMRNGPASANQMDVADSSRLRFVAQLEKDGSHDWAVKVVGRLESERAKAVGHILIKDETSPKYRDPELLAVADGFRESV